VATLVLLCLPSAARAQVPLTATVRVDVSFAARVKVAFDRTAVNFETQAYDQATVVPVSAAPLTVRAAARVAPNTRTILTVQADGPFRSGADTIPANKLSWTMTGTGFRPTGTANANAARMVGDWRGSGSWVGTQTYVFDDSWNYAVGVYTLTMTYTISAP
jgi:hypothetical protein